MKYTPFSALSVTSALALPCALFMLGGLAVTPDAKGDAVIDVSQVGNDVVMTGSGTIDVSGLPIFNSTSGSPGFSAYFSGSAFLTLGALGNQPYARYKTSSFSGPMGPGPIRFFSPPFGSGSRWGVYADTIVLPTGASGVYDVGTSTNTYPNKTLLALGLAEGTYVWTLPTGSTVTVTVPEVQAPNNPPTANAGADQSIRAGATVDLDGSASFDDNTASAALVYGWTFQSKPAGSTATLANASTASPSFVADVAGSYVVALVVTDELAAASTPDTVTISSDNQAPTAAATVDFGLAIVGTTSNFDGSGSTDPENDPLTYAWSITAAPAGSAAALVGGSTSTPSLTTDLEGTYEMTLSVSDFLGAGTPASIEIVATTAANYAQIQIVYASDAIEALLAGQVATGGNQNALGNFLKNATKNIQKGKIDKAINDLNKAIERTDGFPLRGAIDGKGPGRDWITDIDAQADAYALLTAAVAALQQ